MQSEDARLSSPNVAPWAKTGFSPLLMAIPRAAMILRYVSNATLPRQTTTLTDSKIATSRSRNGRQAASSSPDIRF